MQLTPTQGKQSREDQPITGSPPFDSSFSAVPAASLLLWSGAAGHPTTGPPCSHPTRSTYLHSHIQVFISAAPGARLWPRSPCLGLAPWGPGPCCAEASGSPTAWDPRHHSSCPRRDKQDGFLSLLRAWLSDKSPQQVCHEDQKKAEQLPMRRARRLM